MTFMSVLTVCYLSHLCHLLYACALETSATGSLRSRTLQGRDALTGSLSLSHFLSLSLSHSLEALKMELFIPSMACMSAALKRTARDRLTVVVSTTPRFSLITKLPLMPSPKLPHGISTSALAN